MEDLSRSKSSKGKVVLRKCSEVDASIPDTKNYIAIDCEMVGVGRKKDNALGRFHLPLLSLSLMYVMSGSL